MGRDENCLTNANHNFWAYIFLETWLEHQFGKR